MTYKQALEKVNKRLRFGIKPGLERVRALLEALGSPERHMKFVHIAGTNGKGSASTLIASALTESSYKTGLFTSPYINDFRERFQIDREMISEAELISLADRVDSAAKELDRGEQEITEFEFITAMALLWFKERGCDYAVLEVGLGGRFDATNVIAVPEAAAIMSISLDHTAILGGSVGEIAYEKAGILKNGGRAALYPVQTPEVFKVIEGIAAVKNVELHIPNIEDIEIKKADIYGTEFEYEGISLSTPFSGAHQVLNAVTAYETLKLINDRGAKLKDEDVAAGFAKASMPARVQLVSKRPLVLMDGAHNPSGAAALKKLLEDFTKKSGRIAVVGMMSDKDIDGALQTLAPLFEEVIAVPISMERAMPVDELCSRAQKYCDRVIAAKSAEAGVKLALSHAGDEGTIVVWGSFYLAGELKDFFNDLGYKSNL